MVAAEKFKAPEPSPVAGEIPNAVAQTIQEESDEEVNHIHVYLYTHDGWVV